MSDDRHVPPIPNPYAPSGPAPQAPAAEPAPQVPTTYPGPAPKRTRAVWDLVLTIILLVVGFFGMLLGLVFGAALPVLIADSGGVLDPGLLAGDQAILLISHPVLYLAAVGVSIPLLVKRKIAFWVPLAAGVIAAVIFWVTIIAAIAASGI